MAPHSKSTAASAKGRATPAKAKNNNNKKKKKTKESTTPTKDNPLSPQEFDKFYDELIRLAELIPQNQQHADHVSIATILKDYKYFVLQTRVSNINKIYVTAEIFWKIIKYLKDIFDKI